MAKYDVGCIKTTNLPYTVISLDVRKYIKTIFVEKIDKSLKAQLEAKKAKEALQLQQTKWSCVCQCVCECVYMWTCQIVFIFTVSE